MTPSRPRHPDKDIEKFLKRAERRGWVFEKCRKYYMGKCPCGAHLKTVHLTPNKGYLGNLSRYVSRLVCWEESP